MIRTAYRLFQSSLLLTSVILLTACEPEKKEQGLEAVYDAERYRISLAHQRLTVFDHHLQKDVFSSSVGSLISARKTNVSFTDAHGVFKRKTNTENACSQAMIDKAEPSSHFLLLAGNFQSPGCPLRFSLRFEQENDQLHLTAATTDPAYNHLVLRFDAPIHETIFGFGAQVSHLNFKGLNVPVWIQEQGIGRGSQPTSTLVNATLSGVSGTDLSSYFTVPYFLSNEGYGWFLENGELSRFDFRNPRTTRIHSYNSTLDARLISCAALLDCISSYTQFTGRMKNLPRWTQQGAIVGLHGGTETVLQHYSELKDSGVPISGVLLRDWTGRRLTLGGTASQVWWNWERDQNEYPDWNDMAAQLKKDKVRLLGYFNPFLVDVSQRDGVSDGLFQEALDKQFLVQNDQGKPYFVSMGDFTAGLVDLSNPDAFDWLKTIIKKQVKNNHFTGWLADFGERLPADAILNSGESALSYHNIYAQEWARLNAEVVKELGMKNEAVFFMRSGFSQSPSYTPLFSLGHQNVSWDNKDGLQSVIIGLFNSGISGQSLNHADIGGYTSLRHPVAGVSRWLLPENFSITEIGENQEQVTQFILRRDTHLLQRWVELSAFTSLFRSQEGLTPDINVQIYDNEELRQHFAHNAKLFQALAPYRALLIAEAETKGWPMVRNPLLHFPTEPYFYKMSNGDLQFMLGDSIMVAPMLTPKNQSTQRQVFLPEGEWFDVESGEKIIAGKKGKMLHLTPQIGQAPAYLRNNERTRDTIIPALREAKLMQ